VNANIGLILQIIMNALQLAPVAVGTIAKVKELLAADPTVEAGMQAILAGTIQADDATTEMIRQWKAETQT
jgi:hypothetical protein